MNRIDDNDLGFILSRHNDIVSWSPAPKKGKNINPHVSRFYHKSGEVTDLFHIKPVYYETKEGHWRPLSEVAAWHGNKNIVLKGGWAERMSMRYFVWLMRRQRLFRGKELMIEGLTLQPRHMVWATDSTFYPDPDPETTTVDGPLNNNGSSYTTVRNASSCSSAPASADVETGNQNQKNGSTYYVCRSVFLFDTSSIGDTDTISAATFSYYVVGALDNNSDSIELVSSTPASNTALITDDYDQFGTTSYGSTALTGTGNHDITISATGIATISKTGVTKFGTRNAKDISNTSPTSTGYTTIRFADYTGTSTDPKLAVTHAAAASGPAKLKTRDTIAKASVKTIDGIAIASVKTIDTIGS